MLWSRMVWERKDGLLSSKFYHSNTFILISKITKNGKVAANYENKWVEWAENY